MHEVTKKVNEMMKRSANALVTKGGNYEKVRLDAVQRVHRKFPQLDEVILLGGFAHCYAQRLAKLA